jgi:putative radical SAM enzyme (TIGR03279 family)
MMLQNKRAGESIDVMRRFAQAGITMNCQIVCCPGINDGDELLRSMKELAEMHPAVKSVSVVPFGMTKFREGLPCIRPYDKDMAIDLIRSVEPLQKRFLEELDTRFVFPADEFYCLSGMPIPEDLEYEDYPQIENGVGMLRMFQTDLQYAAEDDPVEETAPRKLCIACGTSIAPFLQKLADQYAPRGTTVIVKPIVNHFFGASVTVSGLITGQDLVAQLRGRDLGEALLLPCNMLRSGENVLLDDMTVEQIEETLQIKIIIVESDGRSFTEAVTGIRIG